LLQETVSQEPYSFLSSGRSGFINNVVYYERNTVRTAVNIGPHTSPESLVFSNSLWYAHDDPTQSTPVLPAKESGGLGGVDPMFSDVRNGDYRPRPGSPAIGRGHALAGLTADAANRCFGSPPSIGAYEAGERAAAER
jgi:hypothetical protein